MKISIFGLGYVGSVSLACLGRDGHEVIGVDVDSSKLDLIREGKTPVVEEGMVELMQKIVTSGTVTVTADLPSAILQSEVSFICVGTPSAPNGAQDRTALVNVAHELGRALINKRSSHVLVFRSTVIPGTVEDILRPIIERESGKLDGEGFHMCFQPEFLREGASIRDYDNPPFTIVGANHHYPVDILRRLFGHLPCDFHKTSIRAAEMIKYCCNNFHALKVTFANEVARLCEAVRVNPYEIMDLLCRDTKLNVSSAYLRPGFAFGGSCLPKDLRATLHLAKTKDVELPMLSGILTSNKLHVQHAVGKVQSFGKRRVGVIGLSFKTGTDDLRESPLVDLAQQFIGTGLKVRVYDPEVQLSRLLGANRRFIEQHLPHIGSLLCDDISKVIADSDVLVVGLNDAHIFEALRDQVREGQVVLDLVNIPEPRGIRGQLVGLCW
jgi:GDP-mannose 6-dehydrogenase